MVLMLTLLVLVAPLQATAKPVDAGDACIRPVELEPAAMLGRLSDLEIACLRYASLAHNPQQFRQRASKLLLANAEARRDRVEWARLAEYHLSELDASDAGLMVRYARYLTDDPDSRQRAMYWAERSLDAMDSWTGAARQQTRDQALGLLVVLEVRNANDAAMRWANAASIETEDERDRAMQLARMTSLEWCEHRGAYRMPLRPALDAYVASGGEADTCIESAWAGRQISTGTTEPYENLDWVDNP